ncbi:MAG TPA: hypothetical protein VGJ35_09965 [Burkholderiaceae bacterium]|jgi:hypothetical protein
MQFDHPVQDDLQRFSAREAEGPEHALLVLAREFHQLLQRALARIGNLHRRGALVTVVGRSFRLPFECHAVEQARHGRLLHDAWATRPMLIASPPASVAITRHSETEKNRAGGRPRGTRSK